MDHLAQPMSMTTYFGTAMQSGMHPRHGSRGLKRGASWPSETLADHVGCTPRAQNQSRKQIPRPARYCSNLYINKANNNFYFFTFPILVESTSRQTQQSSRSPVSPPYRSH